ncbi:MAG: right-handed parallel beta-helix repeat-containing protein [Candidatus Micrarchaeia archaeon]
MVDYAPLTSQMPLNCSNLTSANTTYTMYANASINGNTCFRVQAANITLNCAGFSILGNNTSGTYGIYSNQNNTNVVNCSIRGFNHGILYNGMSDGNITNVTADASYYAPLCSSLNVSTCDAQPGCSSSSTAGFCYYNGACADGRDDKTCNAITNCIWNPETFSCDQNLACDGIDGEACLAIGASCSWDPGSFSCIGDSSCDALGTCSAFYMNSSANVLLQSTRATGGIGLNLASSSRIVSSAANYSNAYRCLSLESSPSNAFANIIATATATAGIGIYIGSSSNNTLSNMTATATASSGLYLGSASSNNTIANSTSSATSGYGIYIGSSSNNTLSNMSATATSGYGIYLSGSSRNRLSNITSASSSNRALYLVSSSNNTITNSTATAGLYALYLASSSNYNSISGLNATSTGASGYAMLLASSSNNTIANSTATATGTGSYGLYLSSANSNNISSLNASAPSTSSTALVLSSASNNTIANSTFAAGSYGIYLSSASGNTITNSNATSASSVGVYLTSSSGNTISNSNVTASSTASISLSVSSSNTIANSTLTSNTSMPISLTLYSGSNTLRNNTLISLNQSSLLLSISVTSNNNIVCWNNFTNTSGAYVQDNNGTNSYNSSICNGEGNIYANVIDNSVAIYGTTASTGFPLLKVGTAGPGYPYNNTTSGSKFSCNFAGCADYAPLTNQTPINCSVLSSANTLYTMYANASISSLTCFNVTAANVSLNCNGYTITGDNTTGTFGIYSTQAGTVIENCTIQNFAEGIRYSAATDGRMRNNTIYTTAIYGSGIHLISSAHRNNVTQNIITSGSAHGIYIDGGSNVSVDCLGTNIAGGNSTSTYGIYSTQPNTTIRNCQISNFQHGIYFFTATDGAIDNVNASTTHAAFHNAGHAILLSSSNYNTISNSRGDASAGRGIYLGSALGNNITNSVGNSSASNGIYISSSSNSIVFNSTATSDSYIGMYLDSNANNNVINNSVARNLLDSGAIGYGIYISGSSSNQIINSTASSFNLSAITFSGGSNNSVDCLGKSLVGANASGSYGILSSGESNTTVKNCNISNFSEGIRYSTATDGLVQNNTIATTFSAGSGIRIIGNSHRNNVTQNTITAGNSNGIHIDGGQNTTVDCLGNAMAGINATNSYGIYSSQLNTTIRNCNIRDFHKCIFLNGSNNGTIENSYARSNFFFASVGVAVTLLNSNYTSIRSTNTSAFQDAIYFESSSRNSLAGLNASALNDGAIYIASDSNDNTIANSTLSSSISTLYLLSIANIAIQNVNISATGTNAIVMDLVSSSTISNVNATAGGVTAIYMGATASNIIANNTFSAANKTVFISASSNNTIYNNTLISPTGVLVYTSPYTFSSGNVFYWNNFTSTSGPYVDDFDGGNYFNSTAPGQNEGNIYANVINNSVSVYGATASTGFPLLKVGTAGPGYPYSNTTSGGKLIGNVVDYAPLTNQTPINCSVLSSANTLYTMYANASISSLTCFNVTAANVSLNCNGYTITGTNTTGTYGIYSTQVGTIIENCTIRNFSEGIRYSGATDGRMRNNTIYTTFTGGKGIRLTSSAHRNSLMQNTIMNGGASGIYVDGGSNNTLDCAGGLINGTNAASTFGIYSSQFNTTVINCSISMFSAGIYFNGSSNGTISRTSINTTRVSTSGFKDGIYLSSSSFITIANSSAMSTDGWGIYLLSSSNNTLSSVNASAFGGVHVMEGIRLSSSSGNTLIDTIVSGGSDNAGIYLLSNSNFNAISNSYFFGGPEIFASGVGISLSSSSNNIFSNINSTGGSGGIGGRGIMLVSSSNNTFYLANVTGGAGTSVGPGVSISTNSNNNTVSNSQIMGIGALDISDSAKNNTIANSTINGLAGTRAVTLQFGNNTGNLLRNNTILNATSLLYLNANASGNTFCWNNFTATSGLYVNDTNGSNYYNSSLCSNGGNIYANVIDNSIAIYGTTASTGFPSLKVGTAGPGYPYNNTTSGSKFSCNFAGCADYAPLTNQTPINCSVLSSANTLYTMYANASISSLTCFNVTAANVSLNCNGYTITGTNTTGTYGIYSTQVGTVIENCTIQNFAEGIRYSGATDGRLRNNTITTTFGGGNGIRLTSNAHRNNATQNIITNGNASGIYIDGGQNATADCNGAGIVGGNYSGTYGVYSTQFNTTVRNCNISNFETGIFFETADNGTIDRTNISTTHDSSGYGIYLYNGANYNRITNSNVNSPFTYSMYLITSSYNTITNSTGTSGIASGIDLPNDDDFNTITNSTFFSSGASAIIIQIFSNNNSIINSTAISLAGFSPAISIGYSDNTLTNVTANSTQYYAIKTTGSSAHRTRIINPVIIAATSGSSGSGIYIDGGSNVSVDCQGGSIRGNNLSTSYGIYSSQFNTTVRNCNISNFATGIHFNSSTNGTIDRTNASTTQTPSGDGGYGIYLSNVNYTGITNSNLDSLTGRGIFLSLSSNNTISNTTSASVSSYGMGITGSNSNTLVNSAGASISGFGIYFSGGSSNTISACNATSNSSYGLNMRGSSGTTAANSTITSNTSDALALTNAAISNTIRNNTLVSGNAASNLLHIESDSGSNTFCWNNFTATSGLYVNDTNGSNYYNGSACNGEGNIYANVINNSVAIYGSSASTGFPSLKVGTIGPGYPYNNTTSAGKFSCNFAGCGDAAPLTNQMPLNCSVLSSANTLYTMYANASISGLTCFNVTAANVSLNCNGYTITGTNTTGTYGIYSTQVGTIIENCTIQNFAEGIRYSAATGGRMRNNTIYTTYSGGNGIRLISNAHRNNATQNIITSGNANGIYIDGGQNTTVDCQGARMLGGNYTSTYGIFSDQFNTTVQNCNISNFATGIYFNGATNGTIDRTNASTTRSASGNDGYGILLNSSASYNQVKNSNANSTTGSAICLATNSNFNLIANLTATALTSNAIYLSGSSNNTIANSTGISSGTGMYIQSSSNNTITNSTGSSSTSNGIYITSGSNNLFTNSTGISTTSIGIYISGSSNNTITSSTGISTSGSGLYFKGSPNNTIANCQISGNDGTKGALALTRSLSGNNTIANNTINGNAGDYAITFTEESPSGNLLINNTIMNASSLVYLEPGPGSNTFCWNNFSDAGTAPTTYVDDTNGTNSYNGSACNGEGNIWGDVIENSVIIYGSTASTGFPSLKVGTIGPGYPYNNSTAGGKLIGNVVDYAPLTNQMPLNCSVLSSANTLYTMYANASISSLTCFNVTAANVSLNCNGYTITGTNTTGTYGIYSTQVGTIIENCTIQNFAEGIRYSAATGGRMKNNTIYTTYSGGSGIRLTSSAHRNNVTQNIITAGNAHGIYIDGGYNATVDCQGARMLGGNYSGTYGIFSNQFNTTVQNCNVTNFSTGIQFNGTSSSVQASNITLNTASGVQFGSSANGGSIISSRMCQNGFDIINYNMSNNGTLDSCDTFNGWFEGGRLGCAFACTDLWDRFYGNISGNLFLSPLNASPYAYSWRAGGLNVYFADYDSSVGWGTLQAIGRNTTNGTVSGDFLELDSAFASGAFRDNITATYSTDGSTPRALQNYTVFGKAVDNAPIANSSAQNTSFRTGILWDMSGGGTRYNATTKQTTVWVVRVNTTASDAYGAYDYLGQIPYTLATYQTGNNLISLYAELE